MRTLNWRQATDQQLYTILAHDPMARLSDIAEAKAELERRNRKIPNIVTNQRKRTVYPR